MTSTEDHEERTPPSGDTGPGDTGPGDTGPGETGAARAQDGDADARAPEADSDSAAPEPLGVRLLAAQQPEDASATPAAPRKQRIPRQPRRTRDGSALAVVAFIFALLGLCPAFLPLPIIAVAIGHLARRRQLRGPTPIRGGTLALSALVVGYCLITLYATAGAIAFTLYVMVGNDNAQTGRCSDNLEVLVRHVHQYARDHDGELPTDLEQLRPYPQDLDALLVCPADPDPTTPSYEIVATGLLDDHLRPESTVLIRETHRHHLFGRRVVCYLSGDTKIVNR